MAENLNQRIKAIGDWQASREIHFLFAYLWDRLSTQLHTTAGLLINAAGAVFPKTGASIAFATIGGVPVQIPAGQALPSPVGANFTAGQYMIVAYWAYLVNGVLTYTYTYGSAGNNLASATFPAPPATRGYALLGYLTLTYSGAFTGGTTPLDTATTQYVSPVGAVDPTATLTF